MNSISVDQADFPDSLFQLEFPEHTIVTNEILGIVGLQRKVDNIATGLLDESLLETAEATQNRPSQASVAVEDPGPIAPQKAPAAESPPTEEESEPNAPADGGAVSSGLGMVKRARQFGLFLFAAGAGAACLLLLRRRSA